MHHPDSFRGWPRFVAAPLFSPLVRARQRRCVGFETPTGGPLTLSALVRTRLDSAGLGLSGEAKQKRRKREPQRARPSLAAICASSLQPLALHSALSLPRLLFHSRPLSLPP